jgi:hypothetical protein
MRSSFALHLCATGIMVFSCRQVEDMRGQERGTSANKNRGGLDGGSMLGNDTIDITPAVTEKIDTSKPIDAGCGESQILPVLDFESSQPGALAADAFWKSHGIKFSKPQRIVKTTRVGEAQPTKGERAWNCAKCPGSPSWNRLVDKESEDKVGRHVLASADPKSDIQTIDMVFADLVKTGSFDLIDDDGSEKWTVVFFDSDGKELERKELQSFRGYSLNKTRNGRLLRVEFNRENKDVGSMRLVGAKKSGFFGFAFDNFKMDICPVPK